MASAQAFVLEAELLVELDRGLVVREDVQLELLDAVFACPLDALLEQGAPDAPAPVTRRNHQAEVGDVRARRVRIAREREARDDAVLVLCTYTAACGDRRTARRERRSSPTLRQSLSVISHDSGAELTARPSFTSAEASDGNARRMR